MKRNELTCLIIVLIAATSPINAVQKTIDNSVSLVLFKGIGKLIAKLGMEVRGLKTLSLKNWSTLEVQKCHFYDAVKCSLFVGTPHTRKTIMEPINVCNFPHVKYDACAWFLAGRPHTHDHVRALCDGGANHYWI